MNTVAPVPVATGIPCRHPVAGSPDPGPASPNDVFLCSTMRDRSESVARRQIAGCVMAAALGCDETSAAAVKQIGVDALSTPSTEAVGSALARVGRQVMDALADEKASAHRARIFLRQIAAFESEKTTTGAIAGLAAAASESWHSPALECHVARAAFDGVLSPPKGSAQQAVASFARNLMPSYAYIAYHLDVGSEALKAAAAADDDVRATAVATVATKALALCSYYSGMQRVQRAALGMLVGGPVGSLTTTLAAFGVAAATLGPGDSYERSLNALYDTHRKAEGSKISHAVLETIGQLTQSPAEKAVVDEASRSWSVYGRPNINLPALSLLASDVAHRDPGEVLETLHERAIAS